jgi:PAS domain S-box-containing protein
MFSRPSRIIPILLIFLILIGTGVIVYTISYETRSALKESVQKELMSTAVIAASEIDGDAFARLQAGDETSPVFIRIRDQLLQVKKSNPDIRYIYTMKKSGDTVVFVVDADYGAGTDYARIGQAYPEAEPELLAGFSGPSADAEFTTDQWGSVLSGFSPIKDRSGAVVGIVGVDMDSSDVLSNIDRINLILYLVGIIAMLITAAGILAFEYRRTKNEQELLESEEKFKTLFNNAGAAILIMDQNGIVDCNHQTELVFRGSRAEILNRSPAEYSPERQPDGNLSIETGREYIRKALSGESRFFEWVFIHCDGTPFTAEVSLNRIMLQGTYYLQAIIQDISERKKADVALKTVTKKLSLLNAITFTEIRNAVFALNGYMSLEKTGCDPETQKKMHESEAELVNKITKTLAFAKSYQDLGASPPQWQNVSQSFLMAISHLDFSRITRSVQLGNLEIYADPLLERVFVILSDNVLRHAPGASSVTIGYEECEGDLLILFADNGRGIADSLKEKIFERGISGSQQGSGLFLAREILGITGITLHETGVEGTGARFELRVPKGVFRFGNPKDGPGTGADNPG